MTKQTTIQLIEVHGDNAVVDVTTIDRTVTRRTVPLDVYYAVAGTSDIPPIPEPPEPEPYPVPTEEVAAFWLRIERAAQQHYDYAHTRIVDNYNNAINWCLLYDGINSFDTVAARLADRNPELSTKCIQFADELWRSGARQLFIVAERGSTGYRHFNNGLCRRVNQNREDKDEYRTAALHNAYLSAYSRPWAVLTEKWSNGWNHVTLSRERALSVSSHVAAWDLEPFETWPRDGENVIREEYRDVFIESSVREHIIGIHIPEWLDVDPNEWSTLYNPQKNWAPFMMGLSAKALVDVVDKGLADSWGCREDIVTSLCDLARFVWSIAWREEQGKQGLFYRPRENHVESPHPDLNMIIFPWYAFCAAETGDTFFFECAKKLLVGSKDAWIQGGKQFNQNILWAENGFNRLNWV